MHIQTGIDIDIYCEDMYLTQNVIDGPRIMNDGSKRESINCHHYRKGEPRATLPSCLLPLLLFEFRQFKSNSTTQRRRHMARRTATRRRSTSVKWRASVRDGMAHTLACRAARQLRRGAAAVAATVTATAAAACYEL